MVVKQKRKMTPRDAASKRRGFARWGFLRVECPLMIAIRK
jgi:hypothetical protein